MNKRQLIIGLLCLLLCFPVLAAEQSFSINLNGMPYTTQNPVMLQEETPYVALDELENLLLATITAVSPTRSTVKIGNNTLEVSVNNRQVKQSAKNHTLAEPVLSFNEKLYVPITLLLDLIQYPYDWDAKNNVLELTTLAPSSTNSNSPDTHLFIPCRENLKNYPNYLVSFSSPEALDNKITTALKKDSYLAFVDSTHVTDLLSLTKEKINRSPYHNITLMVREIDFLGNEPVIKDFKTYPVQLEPSSDELTLVIGADRIKATNYWSAFYPGQSLTEMDVDVSLDATLMRHFYYYFRDMHDLKDDKYFKSVIEFEDVRTTTLKQDVYTLSLQNEMTPYTVCIYRLHPSGAITYVVDLIKK
ncbi:MAG: stalk domain-containing protein [Cellulosilyticaceae bacterium]